MGFGLLLLFIILPVLEIVVFIQVGGLIGLWPTLAGIVAAAVIGVAVLRHQGFSVLRRAFETAHAGQMPVAEVFDGFCLAIAGLFLVTPGFITDTAGFLLLVPAVRRWLCSNVGERLVRAGSLRVTIDGEVVGQARGPSRRRPGVVIDAEYETLHPEPSRRPGSDAADGADRNADPASGPGRSSGTEGQEGGEKPAASTRVPPSGPSSPWSP